MKEEHGITGQANIYVLDKDSDITDFGKHNRLRVSLNFKEDIVEVREDLQGLPLSTEKNRRKVLMGWQRMHPKGTRLQFKQRIEGETNSGKSIWYEYEYEIIKYNKRKNQK